MAPSLHSVHMFKPISVLFPMLPPQSLSQPPRWRSARTLRSPLSVQMYQRATTIPVCPGWTGFLGLETFKAKTRITLSKAGWTVHPTLSHQLVVFSFYDNHHGPHMATVHRCIPDRVSHDPSIGTHQVVLTCLSDRFSSLTPMAPLFPFLWCYGNSCYITKESKLNNLKQYHIVISQGSVRWLGPAGQLSLGGLTCCCHV